MSLEELVNSMPFAQHLGIEVTDVGEGQARGRLAVEEYLRSSTDGEVVHGGATYALADTVGGAAVISLSRDVSPTVDMRIDYLAPVTDDIYARAEVIRDGANLAMVHVRIHDGDGTRVATAQGTYKTGGQGDRTPWDRDEHDSDRTDDRAGDGAEQPTDGTENGAEQPTGGTENGAEQSTGGTENGAEQPTDGE